MNKIPWNTTLMTHNSISPALNCTVQILNLLTEISTTQLGLPYTLHLPVNITLCVFYNSNLPIFFIFFTSKIVINKSKSAHITPTSWKICLCTLSVYILILLLCTITWHTCPSLICNLQLSNLSSRIIIKLAFLMNIPLGN